MAMKIMPKTITGSLSSFNKGACDWGWQGFMAYGCQNNIVIVDSNSVQIVQVLDCQCGFITKVKWACENYHHNLAAPYILRLGASEINGHIQIWDVTAGRITAECNDSSINKAVTDMNWVPAQELSRDLLLVLYGQNTLVLWNAENGSKLWKRSYPDTLRMFVFDPFDKSKLAFLGNNGSQDYLVFADFNPSRVPAGNGRKFFISPTNIPKSTSSEKITEKRGSTKSAFRRMGAILVGEKSSEIDGSYDSDHCIEIQFHKACKHHLILVYTREVLILDLDLNQTVSTITTERIGSQFCQILSIRQRDAIFCLHENGTVSLRVRHWSTQIPSSNQDTVSISSGMLDTCDICDPHYYNCCHSDTLRITKQTKIVGFSMCPISEQKLALITSNGRIMIWQLTGSSSTYSSNSDQKKIFTISDLIPHSDEYLSDSYKTSLSFLLIGFLGGLALPPFVIKMCPALTTKNFNYYQPWLAVGCSMGMIQIWNLSSGQLYREYSVHSCGIHGIEWLSLGAILSFGYQALANTNNSTLVRNEISIIELDTGMMSPIRNHMEEDESRIEAIRVSYLKQYFVIIFKEHRPPLEIWDIKSRCLIRRMPRGFPLITAVEWSPTHSVKNLKKAKGVDEGGDGAENEENMSLAGTPSSEIAPTPIEEAPLTLVREHFVFTDVEGTLHHFVVEGMSVKDGSKIPPDAGMSAITSISWKSETLVLADLDGNLNVWNLKARVSRILSTGRGMILKTKYAPGRGNMKIIVMFTGDNAGIEIWDTKEAERLCSVRCPRDMPRIIDCDFAASDRPVLSTADGCIKITELNCLGGTSSPLDDMQLAEPIFNPRFLPIKTAFVLKTLLSNQSWRDTGYNIQSDDEYIASLSAVVSDNLALIDTDILSELNKTILSTPYRCMMTAYIFGDESDFIFWTVALHYLLVYKSSKNSTDSSSSISSSHDHSELEMCYDLVCSSAAIFRREMSRISLHDGRRGPVDELTRRRCAEKLILLGGQSDRAVQLLLETEPTSSNYHVDSLRACLVASVHSSSASQSTVKLVATNLIANNRLSEGVQLLCLIGKVADACRYLQTYDRWLDAAWMAKTSLTDEREIKEVLRRWVDHLLTSQMEEKDLAILVMLSLKNFDKIIEILHSRRQFDKAALFAQSLSEYQYDFNFNSSSDSDVKFDKNNVNKIIENVNLEYSKFLLNLGLSDAAEFFASKAGEQGSQIINEFNLLKL